MRLFFPKYYFLKLSYVCLVPRNNRNQSNKSKYLSCYKVELLINAVSCNLVNAFFCFQKEVGLKMNSEKGVFQRQILQNFVDCYCDPGSHFLFFSPCYALLNYFLCKRKKKRHSSSYFDFHNNVFLSSFYLFTITLQ